MVERLCKKRFQSNRNWSQRVAKERPTFAVENLVFESEGQTQAKPLLRGYVDRFSSYLAVSLDKLTTAMHIRFSPRPISAVTVRLVRVEVVSWTDATKASKCW